MIMTKMLIFSNRRKVEITLYWNSRDVGSRPISATYELFDDLILFIFVYSFKKWEVTAKGFLMFSKQEERGQTYLPGSVYADFSSFGSIHREKALLGAQNKNLSS